jgi:hypothetical protein
MAGQNRSAPPPYWSGGLPYVTCSTYLPPPNVTAEYLRKYNSFRNILICDNNKIISE